MEEGQERDEGPDAARVAAVHLGCCDGCFPLRNERCAERCCPRAMLSLVLTRRRRRHECYRGRTANIYTEVGGGEEEGKGSG